MSPTGETKSLLEIEREKREKALKSVADDIKETANRFEAKLGTLVDEKLCAARVDKITQAVTDQGKAMDQGLQAQSKALDRLASEFAGLRRDMAAIINGTVADKIQEATARFKKPTRESRPLLTRMGDNAKALATIIALAVMLVGGCITGAYYVSAGMNVLKASLAKQEQAVKAVAKEMKEEDRGPVVHYYPLPVSPDAGTPPRTKRRRRPR